MGRDVPGRLEYYTDADIFRLDASEGTIYEVMAVLGTLGYLELELRDAQWRHLETGYSVDKRGSVGLSWRAPASGEYYLVVRAFREGSYILSSRAMKDDNLDSSEEATPLEVGQMVEASIYGEDDLDYFVFQSTQGCIYRIIVELGTLKDSALTLYDRRGEIAFNEDFGDSYASRILWEAPETGTYWLSVSGYDFGTYSLVVEEFTPGVDVPVPVRHREHAAWTAIAAGRSKGSPRPRRAEQPSVWWPGAGTGGKLTPRSSITWNREGSLAQ